MKNKLFTPDEVDEIEKIIISESNSLGKKNGFKDVIEPAKAKALNYSDPVFKGQGVWEMNGGKFGGDYVFTNNRSIEHLIEYKLSIRERHDQVNCGKVCVEDYMVLSQERKHWEKRIGEIPAWETKSFELIICDQNISMGFIKAGDSKKYSVIESRKHVTTGACTARRQDERKNT